MGATQLQLNHHEHFKLHFKPESWIRYQCKITKKWGRCTFLDLHKFKNNVSRIHYNTSNYINYLIIDIDNDNLELTKINMYGGNYYIGQFIIKINNNKIIEDRTLPILNMNSFGI